MSFSQHDHVIQAVTPNGSDKPLHVGPLPGAGWSAEDLLKVQALDALAKVLAVDLVPISQQVTWAPYLRERLPSSVAPSTPLWDAPLR